MWRDRSERSKRLCNERLVYRDMVNSRRENIDIEGMTAYLAETPVKYAILFGSHARGEADVTSDVDVALRFPDELTARERFDWRNRIDAQLQSYAQGDVDVSDIQRLPTGVGQRALNEGRRLVGDETTLEADRQRLDREHELSRTERAAARRAYVEELAEGGT